jgi:hypothetical protein
VSTPAIPMTIVHQALILSGRKSTTLRAHRFDPGVYTMWGPSGASQGNLRVTSISTGRITWPHLTPAEQHMLAQREGYNDTTAFIAAARSLRLGAFIDGAKALWLHHIEPILEETDDMPRKPKITAPVAEAEPADDTTITMTLPDGTESAPFAPGDLLRATKALCDALSPDLDAPAPYTAFGLVNREYTAHVDKVSVPKHVDAQSGYVDQLCNMMFAIEVRPDDLLATDLLPAGFKPDGNGGYVPAAGDGTKFRRSDSRFDLMLVDAHDGGEPQELHPDGGLHLAWVIPDEVKDSQYPRATVMILAKSLPFHLAGELWYPNAYTLTFVQRAYVAEAEPVATAIVTPIDEYLAERDDAGDDLEGDDAEGAEGDQDA